LMSCRVIKRSVEEAMCDELIKTARTQGIKTVRGIYKSTPKNGLVEKHYESLGFSLLTQTDDTDTWELKIDSYQPLKPPISVTEVSTNLVKG
jgi:predicted enzyme involved in methoxymalonyl-ACP biosynthesis